MKKTIMLVFTSLLLLTSCGGGEEQLVLNVLDSKLGIMAEGGGITEGYKFTPSDKNYLLDLEIENSGKEELMIEAIWQYREGGSFRQVVNTPRKVDPGVSELEFPFQSNIDMYRGEYMVEVYFQDKLLAAHRFWVLTPGKELDSGIDIFELTNCSAKPNDVQCLADEICEALYLEMEGKDKPLAVCEAK